MNLEQLEIKLTIHKKFVQIYHKIVSNEIN